ncbi:Monofunctional biosynthetic peptidoglycan transglycosylase [Melia azedarach]|uniref:Monofunctional biosynthetic peptidoglycan transglycosylase n=1 Tax=Melia azedarach TaxID=155640 RepID=A0ACC1XSA6_MELAZ|nr:Monofunctional biosynthetic peptidoglycan transglycosylase [Melia azedarach]
MNTNIVQTLSSNSPLSSVPISLKPSATTTNQTQNLLSNNYHARSIRFSSANSTGSGSSNNASNDTQQPVPPPITPPDTVEIRFRRGSRRRRQREDSINNKQPLKLQASANTNTSTAPKQWEEMSLPEKAVELYMGEKGLLFWLNKFAYASIFVMIGAWILFRFVGPSLNLYQLDAPPLSPSSVFKGS